MSSTLSPNLLEPLAKDVVIYETDDDTTNCCAIIFPPTIKFPVTD